MSLKATRTPCERRGDITSQLEVFCGSSFGRGASPASRVGCAIPLLLFCWSGRRLERGKLLIFWFCCSKSHFSWKWMGVWLRQAPFLKATYLSGDHFFGKPMRILSDEKYKHKNSHCHAGSLLQPWGCVCPQEPPSAPTHFLALQRVFSNSFLQNKNYYQGFFSLHFAWLGHLCLFLIPMFISAPKHLGTGSVRGVLDRQDVALLLKTPPETPDGGKNSANIQFPVKFLYYHYCHYY